MSHLLIYYFLKFSELKLNCLKFSSMNEIAKTSHSNSYSNDWSLKTLSDCGTN